MPASLSLPKREVPSSHETIKHVELQNRPPSLISTILHNPASMEQPSARTRVPNNSMHCLLEPCSFGTDECFFNLRCAPADRRST